MLRNDQWRHTSVAAAAAEVVAAAAEGVIVPGVHATSAIVAMAAVETVPGKEVL